MKYFTMMLFASAVVFAFPALAGEQPTHTITCYFKGNVKPTIHEDVYEYNTYSSGIFGVQLTPNGNKNDLLVGVNNCFLKKKTVMKDVFAE